MGGAERDAAPPTRARTPPRLATLRRVGVASSFTPPPVGGVILTDVCLNQSPSSDLLQAAHEGRSHSKTRPQEAELAASFVSSLVRWVAGGGAWKRGRVLSLGGLTQGNGRVQRPEGGVSQESGRVLSPEVGVAWESELVLSPQRNGRVQSPESGRILSPQGSGAWQSGRVLSPERGVSQESLRVQRTREEEEERAREEADLKKLRQARSLLDIQRERERETLMLNPAKYLDDLKVLHNIYRRQLVAQLVYIEGGQLMTRRGVERPPKPLTGREIHDVRRAPANQGEIKKLIRKIASLRPQLVSSESGDCQVIESSFVTDCLRAHNLYRTRHASGPLLLSNKLCRTAQAWANHLAHTGTFRHRCDPEFGENLFCRNTALILKDRTTTFPKDISGSDWLSAMEVTGEEVAAQWYSYVNDYSFRKDDRKLQASQSPFTQMVWRESREFGVGKARTRNGKIIVVANYSPPGNIEGRFKENVRPVDARALTKEKVVDPSLSPPPSSFPLFAFFKKRRKKEEEKEGRRRSRGGRGEGSNNRKQEGEGRKGGGRKETIKVLARHQPRLTGKNATKVIAAHLLGHTATLKTTEEETKVIINVDPKVKSCQSVTSHDLTSVRPLTSSGQHMTSPHNLTLVRPLTSSPQPLTSPHDLTLVRPLSSSPQPRTSPHDLTLVRPLTSSSQPQTSPHDLTLVRPLTSSPQPRTSPHDLTLVRPLTSSSQPQASPHDLTLVRPLTSSPKPLMSPHDLTLVRPLTPPHNLTLGQSLTSHEPISGKSSSDLSWCCCPLWNRRRRKNTVSPEERGRERERGGEREQTIVEVFRDNDDNDSIWLKMDRERESERRESGRERQRESGRGREREQEAVVEVFDIDDDSDDNNHGELLSKRGGEEDDERGRVGEEDDERGRGGEEERREREEEEERRSPSIDFESQPVKGEAERGGERKGIKGWNRIEQIIWGEAQL